MADIFISYSSEDRMQALSLAAKLRAHGYETWIDVGKISGAMNWSSEIVEAINTASTMLFLISSHSVASNNCAKEVHLASEKGKNILPVFLENIQLPPSMEYALAGLQWVHYEDDEGVFNALVKLKTIKASEPAADADTISFIDPSGKLRLAVLPFDDLSSGGDNQWFADGMMDELINTLGALEKLRVNPRNDVIYYKGKRPRISDIANDLKVRFVVSGSVQKAGEKIRIRVSLSDAATRSQIWSEKYDGTFDDIFELQDLTSRAISEALQLKLSEKETEQISEHGTNSPEAYELYLKAKEIYYSNTRSDLEYCLKLCHESVKIDPNYTDAHAEITNSYMTLYRHYQRTPDILEKALAAADKVRAIEGESPKWHWIMSAYYLRQGKVEEAFPHAEASANANFGLGYEALGFVHQVMGNFQEAARARETFITFRENETIAHFNLLVSLNELGDKERLREAAMRAIPVFERHIRLNPGDFHNAVKYANVLAFAQLTKRATEKGKELLTLDIEDGLPLYNLACLFLTLGNKELGMKALEQSIDKGLRNVEAFRKDTDLNSIRGTPEFETLMQKLDEKITAEAHADR